MRIATILIGIALIAFGLCVVLGKFDYTRHETPLKLGQVEVTTTVHKPLPTPVGYADIVIGGALLAYGVFKKSK